MTVPLSKKMSADVVKMYKLLFTVYLMHSNNVHLCEHCVFWCTHAYVLSYFAISANLQNFIEFVPAK